MHQTNVGDDDDGGRGDHDEEEDEKDDEFFFVTNIIILDVYCWLQLISLPWWIPPLAELQKPPWCFPHREGILSSQFLPKQGVTPTPIRQPTHCGSKPSKF